MGAALSVVIIVSISFVIIRVATSALVMTGMARESARFQARSAFLGVGFTTSEAESIVDHPVRRRIAIWLMWLGNAGVVTVLGGLILSFGNGGATLGKLGIILGGFVALVLVARSPLVEKPLERLIQRSLHRFGGLDVRDYAGLLHVKGGWTIDELKVEEGDWIAGQTLGALDLRDEGLLVLGIDRADGEYVGTPRGRTVVAVDDTLVIYGQRRRIAELDDRRRGSAGEQAHADAIREASHFARLERLPTQSN